MTPQWQIGLVGYASDQITGDSGSGDRAGAFESLNILAAIAETGAGFSSLDDAWAGTTTLHGRLMLTVLGGLVEFERELIRARTGEGHRGGHLRPWGKPWVRSSLGSFHI